MNRLITLIFVFDIIISCSKGGGGDESPAPVTPVVVLNPGKPSLVYPDNGAPCEDGTSINDTQSEINFQWTAAQNAESYLLSVTNLTTNTEQTFNSAVANISVALVKADPYRWTVTAQGKTGSTPAVSDAWKFYLAGDAQVNYAPFPPELLAPSPGATVFASADNKLELQWSSSDVDNDLSSYDLYIDTTDGTTLLQSVSHSTETTSVIVDVTGNTVYYWKVVATDANGNISDSGIYSFRVN